MSQDRTLEVSEAKIAVHWQEEAYVHPPEKFVAQANLTDKTVFEQFSLDNFPDCFKQYADLLDWYKTWDVTLNTSNPPFWRWFISSKLNVSYNCVDRHLAKCKNKTAIHFVPRAGARNHPTRYLPRTVRAGKRGSQRYCRVLDLEKGGPSDAAPADGGGAFDHDPRLRKARRYSLASCSRL